jgi:hypothetical protein
MAEHHAKLEITPRVVDLGDRVIQLHHVVSVGQHRVHPLRPAGFVALAIGLGLIGNVAVTQGGAAFAPAAGGSVALWVAFAALGVGLFLLLYVRRVLSIQTSDGRRVELSAATDATATDLIQRVRHAMEASGGAAFAYRYGSAPSAAQGASEAAAMSQRGAASSGQPPQDAAGQTVSQSNLPASWEQVGSRTMPAGRHGGGYANGHAGGKGPGGSPTSESGSITEQAVQAYRRAGGGGTASPKSREQPATGASERRLTGPETGASAGGGEPFALPATLPSGLVRDDGAQDLQALMEHVRRADVQHKEALLDLLRVVEDHYRGRASREDALAHWRSFADYVVQYLSDVDGLIAHTERFGRHMVGR